MKLVTHKHMKLIPMAVIDLEVDYVLDEFWKTSEAIADDNLHKGDCITEEHDICQLDPGGMLNTKEKWMQFDIDSHKFEIQFSKLEWVIVKVERAKERIPNGKRIGLFHYNIICSLSLCERLLEKLKELDKTDAAMHAQLDDAELKAKLEATGHIIFPSIPREPGVKEV